MTKLKAIKFTNSDEIFNITEFNNETLTSVPYGVVMPDGTVVSCSFGLHSRAYSIAITTYILKNFPEKFYDKDLNLTEYVEENSTDGVIEDPYELSITSYGLSQQLDYYKNNEPELFKHISKASFINAKNYSSDHSDFVKDHAEEWVNKNAKYIWAIRVFFLMKTDDFFWDDNQYPEWLNLMWKHFEIEFEKYKAQSQTYSAAGHRFRLPEDIIEFFNPDQQELVETIIEKYPMYREILGYPPYYGSLWHHNFVDVDMDSVIFKNFTP